MNIQMKGEFMKKKFVIKNLDCAVCATKLEDAIKKIDGVKEVQISFMTEKMKLVVDDTKEAEVMKEVRNTIHKLEPDVEIMEK